MAMLWRYVSFVTLLPLLVTNLAHVAAEHVQKPSFLAQVASDAAKDANHKQGGGFRLVPGIAQMAAGGVNTLNADAGIIYPDATKYHSGSNILENCQPWENCTQQMNDQNLSTTTTLPPASNISDSGEVQHLNRTCPEWFQTQQGCDCIDTCDCNVALFGGKCVTADITYMSTDGEQRKPCGDLNPQIGKFMDTCMPAVAATPEPAVMYKGNSLSVHLDDGETEMYRGWNHRNNQRFLPKDSCFSRDYYCAKFPKFPRCNWQKTYHLSEAMQNDIEMCEAIGDQKSCEGKETCGNGTHGTCRPLCVWTEDAPQWFRDMRGFQNQHIKRTGQDPATVREGRWLPVLQPGFDGGAASRAYANQGTIIKKPTLKAGQEASTPAPVVAKGAGEIGSGRSAGFIPAGQVGQDVGSDAVPIRRGFAPGQLAAARAAAAQERETGSPPSS